MDNDQPNEMSDLVTTSTFSDMARSSRLKHLEEK
jgi:hypothetical protein